MAKANAISSIGSTLVQIGDSIDRIYERRSREQADNALTEYTDYMTRASNGFDEPSTGRRVPGTLETPYSPGNDQDEPTGPSIATAKAVKEWMEKEDGTYAKLSPRAKEEFDRRAARITQSVMDRAMRQEYDQMQAFRQANDKAAFEADRKHVASLGVDVSPAGNEQWMIDMMAARDAQVMREVGLYQKDPSNGTLANAKWLRPDVESYANHAAAQVMEIFTADRVEALLLAARNEPDDARREAFLATAVGTAGMEYAGKRVLSEEAFQKAKLEAENVRIGVQQQRAAAIGAAIKEAEAEFGHLYSGRKTDPERLNQLKAAIPPAEFARLEQKAADAQTADEVSAFRGQLEIYESQRNVLQVPGDTAKDRIAVQIASMRSPVARATALNLLREADRKWAEGQSNDAKSAQAQAEARTASNAALIVENGGALAPDGTWRTMSEAQQIDTLIALGKTGSLQPKEYFALKAKIAKRRPTDDEHLKTIWQTIGAEIGNDRVAEHFAFKDGMVEFGNVSPKGRKLRPNDDLGDVEFAGSDAEGEAWRNEVDARAELVRIVAQNALEYARQIPASGRPDEKGNRPPPMSVADFVKKSLRPEDNEAARRWTEADVRLNAIRMRSTTIAMEQWLKSQEFDAFADKE
ncbi:MAG TPA: hypothetical protein P5204_08390 [Kiritimatiellia bacterium]|nr:hypothetical protein [Kiritimatiellia bacterium]